jgi:integrase
MVTKDDYNLNYTIERLKNSSMLPHNRRKATEYYEEKIAQGARKISYSYVLRILIELGEAFKAKKFEDISKQELISFFNNLKPKDNVLKTRHGAVITIPIKSYSKNTLWQYKASVKTFYRWLFGKESDETPPEAVRWIKRIGNKNCDSWDKLKKEIITPKEATRILKAAKNARNKAIVAILWEYGLRASELLNMKKSDLKIRENYIEFEVDGKTGKRGVILVESKPFLEAWLAELEEKKNQLPENMQDYIWIAFSSRGYHKKAIGNDRISRDALNVKLKGVAKRAGITKRVWTHGFRHSAATRDAVKGYNEAKLRIKYGWSKQSQMPSVYIHFADQNLKKEILIEKGIWKPDKKEEAPLSSQTMICPFCSTQNVKENDYCNKCGKPLKIEQLKEMEKKSKHLEILRKMIQEELEKKGYDLAEMATILAAKMK